MWIFGKQGHFAVGQDPFDHEQLFIHAQLREEIEPIVAMLEQAAGGQRHEIEEQDDGDYRFLVMARRSVVAEVVAKMVLGIDYGKHIHSFHVDFGAKPGFLLWVNKTGLQVATVRE